MSITEELRKWATGAKPAVVDGCSISVGPMTYGCKKALLAIADRIDAEHEKAIASVMNDALYHANEKDMAELGWMRMPKDADGEIIHIGDVMAYTDNTKPMEVVAIVPPVIFLTEDGPRYADMCRHYHAPTVEDVLREFAQEMSDNMGMYTGEAIDADEWRDADAKTVEKYAQRLQLGRTHEQMEQAVRLANGFRNND